MNVYKCRFVTIVILIYLFIHLSCVEECSLYPQNGPNITPAHHVTFRHPCLTSDTFLPFKLGTF